MSGAADRPEPPALPEPREISFPRGIRLRIDHAHVRHVLKVRRMLGQGEAVGEPA